MNWQRKPFRQLWVILLIALLSWGLSSCSAAPEKPGVVAVSKPKRGKLAEVSPPFAIQSLKQFLDPDQPQVKIVSPQADQVLADTQVKVKFQVSDLSLYKDEEFELGPYLQVMLDNQPYAQVHDTREPLILENLTPGTHTLRVFAVRPWHESFKNEGAFAQVSFHLFARTPENQPTTDQPLLTYNAPQGTIGAEPVLLDFYLTNTPLHLVAQSDPEDDISDWQIRCTVNGESFTFDRWEPIYLKGFKPGQNWVQLELIDEKGNLLPNVFNSTVQLINYQPGGTDTLSKLTRGELTAEDARKIVDPNYVPPAEPELILEPSPEPPAEPEATTPVEKPQASDQQPEVDQLEAKETEAIPEVILEPDLTREPTPETMPPELVQPASVESSPVPAKPAETPVVEPERVEPKPAEAKSVEPEQVQTKPTEAPFAPPSPVIQPNTVKAAEPTPEKLLEVQPAQVPIVEPVTPPKPLVPESTLQELETTVDELIDREPYQSPTRFNLPDSLKIFQEALPERGDTQPMQMTPVQPVPDPDVAPAAAPQFAPALLQEARSVMPESSQLTHSTSANLDELKQGLEQLFQPAEPGESEPLQVPLQFSAIDPSQITPSPAPETLPDLIDSVLRDSIPKKPAAAEPTPKLINLFDQVKDFFEGLKKQPTELKLPFLEDASSDPAAPVSVPETLNQLLEDLFTPEQPAP